MRAALFLLLTAGCRQLLGFESLDPAAGGDGPPKDNRDDDGPPAGCVAHDECESKACLPDGRCANESEVAYAAPEGSGNACSKAAPCARVTDAVGTGRRTIKISGTIRELIQITVDQDNGAYVFLAEPGAKVIREGGNGGPMFNLKESESVTIVDLEITNTTNGIAGIRLEGGALTLDRVKVIGCQGRGLDVSKGSQLTITRSTFASNTLGGAVIQDAPFTISNSLFVNNGSNGSTVGGIRMLQVRDGSSFELNTIANNVTDATNSVQDGVNCGAPFVAHSNIVSNDEISTTCSFQNSLFDSGPPPGSTNLIGAPDFLDTTTTTSNRFYRISSESSAIDHGVSSIAIDIDGQPRPQGLAPDMGADEAPEKR